MKLIYSHISENKEDFNQLTDQELEKEKQRLLNELKENESESGENKS